MLHLIGAKTIALAAALTTFSGCAALNRTRPQDMTIPEHEEASRRDLEKARQATDAAAQGGRSATFNRVSASRHRELAEEHARAAAAAREQATASCSNVTPAAVLRAMRVATVEPIIEREFPFGVRSPKGYYPEKLQGARLAVLLGEDVAPESAARAIECQAVRFASGLDPDDGASPLGVRSAKALARAEPPGILIEIRADPDAAAEEILRRSREIARRTP